jgi:hypothetical protein
VKLDELKEKDLAPDFFTEESLQKGFFFSYVSSLMALSHSRAPPIFS